MRANFSGFGQHQVAQVEIDETRIVGSGEVVTPYLSLPLRLDVWNAWLRPHEGIEVMSVHGKLSSVAGLISASMPVHIGFLMPPDYEGYRNQLHPLEFPLDPTRIVTLERLRNGGNLTLHLNLVLIVRKLRALNERPPGQPLAEVVWGHVHTQSLHLDTDLTIPRDVWISQVLPHVGHGVTHVIELPAAPLEACKSLEHAFKALQQAQERHRIGLYDDAVGKCRVALDKFFEYEEKVGEDGKARRVPILAKSWKKVGHATYEWLNAVFGVIKDAANPSHHSPNEHFDQIESQMVISITATVIAYAARTMSLDEK